MELTDKDGNPTGLTHQTPYRFHLQVFASDGEWHQAHLGLRRNATRTETKGVVQEKEDQNGSEDEGGRGQGIGKPRRTTVGSPASITSEASRSPTA